MGLTPSLQSIADPHIVSLEIWHSYEDWGGVIIIITHCDGTAMSWADLLMAVICQRILI